MRNGRLAFGILAALVILALLAPVFVTAVGVPPPDQIDSGSLSPAFGVPSGPDGDHVLGVDWLGRDVLSRTVGGLRSSLSVAGIAVSFALVVGVGLGMLAGYRGGWPDWTISRSVELFLVIPYVALAAGIATSCSRSEGCVGGSVRPGIHLTGIVIGLATWPLVARLVRERTRQLRDSGFVEAARVQGAGGTRILFTEILPNLLGPLAALTIVLIPQAILAEAGLTFLGIGLPGGVPSWGGMISSAAPVFPVGWWILAFPGAALFLVVLSLSLLVEPSRSPGRTGWASRS